MNGKSLTENAAKIVITDKSKFNYKFLYYALTSNFAQSQIEERTKAVGVPKLAIKRIETIQVSLISIEEQQKIVTEFEKLETEIAQIENELSTMDEQKEQILKKHLARKIHECGVLALN